MCNYVIVNYNAYGPLISCGDDDINILLSEQYISTELSTVKHTHFVHSLGGKWTIVDTMTYLTNWNNYYVCCCDHRKQINNLSSCINISAFQLVLKHLCFDINTMILNHLHYFLVLQTITVNMYPVHKCIEMWGHCSIKLVKYWKYWV